MNKPSRTRDSGQKAEAIAASYLNNHNIRIIEQNFHSRFGEIDLVALDNDNTLIFIEVRYRKDELMMQVAETIDPAKCRKLIKTSEYYLTKHLEHHYKQCRYDFIGIVGDLKQPSIEWIKNAFSS